MPAGSAPQWEGGEASATYVLQARVLFACINFPGTLRNVFCVCVCTRLCTCSLHYICLQFFALTY